MIFHGSYFSLTLSFIVIHRCVIEQQKHVRAFDFRTLPHVQQQIITEIKEGKTRLAPFAIYLQVENMDGLMDNDIVSFKLPSIHKAYKKTLKSTMGHKIS